MIHLHISNRMEPLERRLAAMSLEGSHPLQSEAVAVSSNSARSWLMPEMAGINKISANISFFSPRVLIDNIITAAIGEGGADPLEREDCVWRIMKLLPDLANSNQHEFAVIARYLDEIARGENAQAARRYLLSKEIAGAFNDYLIYRPEALINWEKDIPASEALAWQALLLRALLRDASAPHFAQRVLMFAEAISSGRIAKIENTWPRISIFGVSHLPRIFLHAFAQIARLIDVHIFALNPSREYWLDNASARAAGVRSRGADILRMEDGPSENESAADDFSGNRLLSLWGMMGRDFWRMLAEIEFDEREDFTPIKRGSLLSHIQADILENLPERQQGTKDDVAFESIPSVLINSCHSPRRELETLCDFLLDVFAHHNDILPKDIIVMAPNINDYVPHIPFVWSASPLAGKVSFKILGKHTEDEAARAFLSLLETAGGRFAASEIIALLEIPAIGKATGFSARDVETARLLIDEAGIRWGLDERHRAKYDLPAFDEYSWRHGFKKLLLGYALGRDNEQDGVPKTFAGIVPIERIEGDIADTLGRLIVFIDKVAALMELLNQKRALSDWRETLARAAQDFIGDEHAAPSKMLSQMQASSMKAGFAEEIPFAVVREYLRERIVPEERREFISGDITFCSLLPLRPMPFQVICLMGMNAADFPRQEMRAGFNFIAQQHRLGDKTRRDEDLHLFLEALLNARRNFYLSFVGQDIKDNSPFPPAAPVEDLLAYIKENFRLLDADGNEEAKATRVFRPQRLHAFSRHYFEDNNPRSYSSTNLQCAQALIAGKEGDEPPLSREPLSSTANKKTDVGATTLIDFFKNPCRVFLKQSLDIRLRRLEEDGRDEEDFALDYLEKFLLLEQALDEGVDLREYGKLREKLSTAAHLPVGAQGEISISEIVGVAVRIIAKAKHLLYKETLPPLEIALAIGGFNITGVIAGIGERHLTRVHPGRFKARDLLAVWIEHLLINAAAKPDYPRMSNFISMYGQGIKIMTFEETPEAPRILEGLLDIFAQGLNKPLPFFPETSYAFFQAIGKGETEKKALMSANKKWAPSFMKSPAEKNDPPIRLCFGEELFFIDDEAPRKDEFIDLAKTIFGDIEKHLRAGT